MDARATLSTTQQPKQRKHLAEFDNEDFLVDLHHYFDKSSKRKVALEEFCLFCEQEYRKIIKYVSTRWLSLEAAVTRSLKIYSSLRSYFLSITEENGPRFKRLVEHYSKPMTDIYLYFYQSVLQMFITFSLYLRRHDPQIPTLHDKIDNFMRELACKFVEIDAVYEADEISSLDVDNAEILKEGQSLNYLV